MNRKAIIFGIKGYKLTGKEKKLFSKVKPWGIIIFSRNIKDINQLKLLILSIKRIMNDNSYPILIDQEGGKVSRLNKIIDLSFFNQEILAKTFLHNKKLFYEVYKIYINKVCEIFNKVGININTVPVLDVRRKKSHNIIGNRSFSKNPRIVTKLGNICVNLYKKNKIATVVKHIPGHGLSLKDSHFKTPTVNAKKKLLKKNDFYPFKFCKSPFAMTAHVIFKKYDTKNTATHSKFIINNIIRKYIGFKGILISDDISMKSLHFKPEENALRALLAGCNLVLHCNANIKEMINLSKVIPRIDILTKQKTSHFYKLLM